MAVGQNMTDKLPILAIIGPTASGKSALALQVARHTGAQILSVDSMQVYQGMDIGTAKPSPAEQQEITHHLIDIAPPDQSFTVADFVRLADQTIATAQTQRTPLIAAGGTPMYYKALFTGLFDGPSADPAIRNRLRQHPNDQLHTRLQQIDPPAAQRIHPNDTRRLIRALEVFELTGRPISSFQTAWEQSTTRHPVIWIGLQWDKSLLNRRINARVKQMVTQGWLGEVKSLLAQFGQLSPTAQEAAGYQQWIDHLSGKISFDDALESTKIATRQLAGRQIKWFRRFTPVHWLDAQAPLDDNTQQCLSLWNAAKQP